MRFGLCVAIEPFADGFAQVVEGCFRKGRQGATLVALAAHGSPPAVYAFAKRTQPIEHRIDDVAIGIEVSAAFVGDGVELF